MSEMRNIMQLMIDLSKTLKIEIFVMLISDKI